MIHNGIKCRRSLVYGWREGNPETDRDLHNSPVDSMYFAVVQIKDCPVVGRCYHPEGVKQAFPLAFGGTNYGYGKAQIVKNGQGRHVRVRRDGKVVYEWLCSYAKTPIYVIQDGRVYVGACYRELKAGE